MTKMNDEEIMGSILTLLCDKRYDSLVHLTTALAVLGVPQNMLRSNLNRMKERGLIEWLDQEVKGLGMGRITDYGIKVAKNEVEPPIPMKIHYGDIYVTQVNSPASQIAVGDRNIQSIQQQSTSLIKTIEDVLSSDGLNKLSRDQADFARTLAELVRGEIQKSVGDVPKIKCWVERLTEIVKGAGLMSEAAKLTGALIAWLSSLN
jgi:hypothetical protein